MHKSEYIEYLKSDEWQEKREYFMESVEWICSKCGEKATQIHHLKYDNIGNEELDVDVIALCTDCHNEIHGKDEYGYGEYKSW